MTGPSAARRSRTALRALPARLIGAGRRRKGVAAIALSAAMVAGAVTIGGVAVGADSGPSASEQASVIAYDAYNRSVRNGLTKAEIGGKYTVTTNGAHIAVARGAARLTNLKPGLVVARLTSAQGVNVRSRVSFQIPKLPKAGGSLYVSVSLRTQRDNSNYLAKARVSSNGSVAISFTRVKKKKETAIGGEVRIGQKIKAGGVLTLEAEALGTKSVALDAHAWVGSSVFPGWQVKVTDKSKSRLSKKGYIATNVYVSKPTSVSTINITELSAWAIAVPGTSTGSGTQPPKSTTKPTASTTAPRPAPTTTAARSSSAPTTTRATPTTAAGTTSQSVPPPPASSPPSTSGGSGSAALGSTSYPVPAGAVFVATNGSDSSRGTSSAPVRTINRAVAIAPSGATIVVRTGSYHEDVEVPSNKRVTIQSAPGNTVWLDGSSDVSGWTRSGSTWIKTGWKAKFNSVPSYTGNVSSAKAWGFVNPAFPMAAHPDQVWVNGVPLTQVGSAAKVTAGTFFSDYKNNRIVMGTNPSGRSVRASDIGVAMTIKSANSVVRGIGVHNFATAVQDMGAIRLMGSGSSLENVISSDNATTGVSVLAKAVRLNRVSLQENGMLGLHGNYADGVSVSSALISDNNVQQFNKAPVAGGLKFSRTRGITVRNSVIKNNLGTAVWFDESSYNVVVVNNTIDHNRGHGISFEISSLAVIADNVITNNASDGIKLNDAGNVRVWNNTLGGNAKNMDVVQDVRRAANRGTAGHDPRQHFPDPTVTWLVSNVQVMNNVLNRSAPVNIYVRDYSGQRSANAMNVKINGNYFTRTSSKGESIVVWTPTAKKVQNVHTVAELAGTGAGTGNAEGVIGTPGANAVRATAQPLPGDIAALVGVPAGIRKVGAF